MAGSLSSHPAARRWFTRRRRRRSKPHRCSPLCRPCGGGCGGGCAHAHARLSSCFCEYCCCCCCCCSSSSSFQPAGPSQQPTSAAVRRWANGALSQAKGPPTGLLPRTNAPPSPTSLLYPWAAAQDRRTPAAMPLIVPPSDSPPHPPTFLPASAQLPPSILPLTRPLDVVATHRFSTPCRTLAYIVSVLYLLLLP
jgi:hypothetical protein